MRSSDRGARRLALLAAMGLAACGGESGGGRPAGTAADAGPDGGARPMRDGAPEARCLADEDCPDGEFCRTSGASAEGACAPGCRTRPDTCEAADPFTICDPASRGCAAAPCAADADCRDGHWCDAAVCRPGCRLAPDDCGGDRLCDPATRACTDRQACCGARNTCSMAVPSACDGDVVPLATCAASPCRDTCRADDDCATGEYCAPWGRCFGGCRLGAPACPTDLACDPATRDCVERGCAADADCDAWQSCDGRVCRDGCRDAPDACAAPDRCAPDRRCRPWCADDGDCGDDAYCDAALASCRPRCAPETHAPCAAEERCDASRCVVGCRSDAADLGDGDDSPARAVRVALEGGAASVADRGVCPGDADYLALPLAADERVEITLSYDASEGALALGLYAPDGTFLAGDDGAAAPKRLRLPALGARGGLTAGDHVVEVRGVHVPARVSYRIDVRTVPEDGCFPDDRDPGDDRAASGRSAGERPQRSFDDTFDGSLCAGDDDWFCFPMGRDDGLEVTLVAPPGCDDLGGELFDRALLEAGDPTPAHALGEAAATGDGTTVRRFEATPDAAAFSASTWCLRLHAADAAGRCEDYALTLGFRRGAAPCSDQAEPNDGLDRAFALDGEGPLAGADGRLPPGVDLELPRVVRVCEGDVDLYALQAQPGDTLRAWIAGDAADGSLEVGFLDELGQPQGRAAGLTAEGQARREALALAAGEERLFVRVRGIGAGTGAYRLAVRRDPGVPGECVQDVNEMPGNINDGPALATVLAAPDPRRLAVQNGSLCGSAGGPDEDWYRFRVEADRTRLCAAATFRQADGDVDLELYRDAGPAARPCRSDADCGGADPEAERARCIGQQCQAPVASALNHTDGELVELAKAQVTAGDYYLRVFSSRGDDNLYDVQVTQVPEAGACERDWRERERANDDRGRATFLGAGRAAVCDAWICHDERAAGDWYGIHVPPGADRTALITYAPREDGVLLLALVNPADPEGGFVESFELQTSVQCINIRGGDAAADVFLGVAADSVVQDGDARVDYTLHVAPTDLDANPRGACDALSGGAFGHVRWPVAQLP